MKNKLFILLVMTTFSLNCALYAQQKYALLIGGDYKPGTEIPTGDKWNNGQAMDPVKGWDEFWNDTYLMWELLYDDPISNFSNDNIEVLFADGIDYTFDGQNVRYKASYHELPSVTDDMATKTNVIDALDDLANIQEEDYVFIWIMSNGGNTGNSSFVYLWGYDPGNPTAGTLYDTELKTKLDLIPAHKKVVVVQAPNSGGFATTLQDDNTLVYTSSGIDEPASRANDTPYDENEEWGNPPTTYYHGEFGYHFYSPLRGVDPGENTSYGPFPFEDANTFNDDVITFEECFGWENLHNNAIETPVTSDIGFLSTLSSIQYSTLLNLDIISDKNFIGTIGVTGLPPTNYTWTETVISNGNVTFSRAKFVFFRRHPID